MGSEKKSRKRRSSPSSSSESTGESKSNHRLLYSLLKAPSQISLFLSDDSRRSRKHSKRDDKKERKITKDGDKERKRKSNHKSHEHSGSREARGGFKLLDSLIGIFIQGNTSFSSRSSQAIPKILLFGTFLEKKTKGKHKHSKKLSDAGFKELSDEDYFSRNNEFSTWLKEERGLYFSDLSSEAARDLFSSFVKAWNRHKLQPQYYKGIAGAPRTAHNWKIKH
ncbi:hypothetical protein KSP40_PGU014912 [Platanthera guangdongensis]|uniref:Uncharacterized protein n=1 Tax=Platanthera guangdongensis TaxID=2320717 RepID=A0ABR2N5K5_9ASPA